MTETANKIPELLAPAGSPEALHAAIEAGADAVYFGGGSFSNRMRAKNFSPEELIDAISLCNTYGVRSYITMNTRLRDREIREAISIARGLYEAGASAFITADAGLAALIRESLPSAEIHASTQMTGMSALDAITLARLGFKRMVCPRELSFDELCRLVKDSPIEIEMFIHGAHCVSVSGQCLMSWAMGGRSGNRGECAQPCRLPYRTGVGKCASHPLSLKDMCLARHVPEIIASGASSLKIEGRLKSADYVYGVTRIYRALLDGRRAATDGEIAELDGIFSRDGFTDGYFKGRFVSMTGMRREDAVSAGEAFTALTRRVPVIARAELSVGEAAILTMSDGVHSVCVSGDEVQPARSAPVDEDGLYKNLSKLGTTPYSLDRRDFSAVVRGDGFMAASQVNELRRRAVAAFADTVRESFARHDDADADFSVRESSAPPPIRTAEFMYEKNIPAAAEEYFDVIFVSDPAPGSGRGLALPAWCADGEWCTARIGDFAASGGRYVLCHTVGQLHAAAEAGLEAVASFRMNLTGAMACVSMADIGGRYSVLSPELNSAAVRDVSRQVPSAGAVVYGKLPVMLLRRCIMSDSRCSGRCGGEGCLLPAGLTDRRGATLPVHPAGDGTNVILNPVPIYMGDKIAQMGKLGIEHYIFTDESLSEAEQIIYSYKSGSTPEEAGLLQIKRV